LGECCRAPPQAGLGFGDDFEGIFKIKKQFSLQNLKVRINLFCSASGGMQSGNFALFKGIYGIDGKFEPIIAFLLKSCLFFFWR
jgi:hypothetical protein